MAAAQADQSGDTADSVLDSNFQPVDDSTDGPSQSGPNFDDASANNDSGPDNGGTHMQKRRRVTRACDECRRKKIKCDGRQPCTHCTVYSYDCTYDQPSHRRRNPAPLFLEQMEAKVKRAEAIVKLCFPNMTLDDPKFDAILEQGFLPPGGKMDLVRPKSEEDDSTSPSREPPNPKTSRVVPTLETNEHDLETMVRSKGTLDLDDQGHYTYFGASSGLNFLKRIGEDLGDVHDGKSVLHRGRQPGQQSSRIMSDVMMRWPSPERSHWTTEPRDSPSEHEHDYEELPARNVARRLCHYALEDAAAIISPVHQPSFYKSFDRIYNRNSNVYEDQDHKFLPLLYTVMALGCLFAKDGESELERNGYASATEQGYFEILSLFGIFANIRRSYKYFWHARQLMDITDCRDLVTLQAVVFMILFLQCSAKLSTCYSYIGVAVRSAIRMGMHRSFKDHFSPIDLQLRKRLFWAIRKMDIFVSALLGLPLTLSDEDIDQDYPLEIDDEHISADGVKPMTLGTTSNNAAANADFRLTAIMTKLLRSVYPVKGVRNLDKDPSKAYRISYAVIKDIENDLQKWMESLPEPFKPGGRGCDSSEKVTRIRHLLRMAYAFVQMLLYRPFLHYVSPRCHTGSVDPRSYACAEACISVSRNIIHITAEMKRSGFLAGSYWFIHYTTFFAVLSLVFYGLESPAISQDLMRDAKEGRETMAGLAQRSMAADRCTATLTVLFEHFAEARSKQPETTNAKAPNAKKREAADGLSFQSPSNVDPSKMPNPINAIRSSGVPFRRPQPDVSLGQGPFSFGTKGSPGMYQSASSTNNSTPSSGMAPSPRYATTSNQTISATMPIHQQAQLQNQHPQPNNMFLGNMPQFSGVDVSTMMFPSRDPMAYPNQPMLTLEQSGGYPHPKHGDVSSHFSRNPMAGIHSNGTGNMEGTQFDNSMMASQHGEQPDFGNFGMMPGQDSSYMVPSQPIMPGSSTFPGMNFDDIWGSEHWG